MQKLDDIILKEGDKVYFSDGDIYDVDDETDGLKADEAYMPECIITKIERLAKYETIYEAYEAPKSILSEKEKEYLEAVIRPFRNKIEVIQKHSYESNGEFISIDLEDDNIELPTFEKGTMYKGMEIDKEYTLEELGLFKE